MPAQQPPDYDLRIDHTIEPSGHRLVLHGELDLASAPTLREAVARVCAEGASELVLDIGQLRFVDSTGLRCILDARAACESGGCQLSVAPEPELVSPQVRRLLQVTGLLQRLPFEEQGSAG